MKCDLFSIKLIIECIRKYCNIDIVHGGNENILQYPPKALLDHIKSLLPRLFLTWGSIGLSNNRLAWRGLGLLQYYPGKVLHAKKNIFVGCWAFFESQFVGIIRNIHNYKNHQNISSPTKLYIVITSTNEKPRQKYCLATSTNENDY